MGVYKDSEYPATKPVDEHEEIMKLVIYGEAESAEMAMRAYIMRSLQNSIQAFGLFKRLIGIHLVMSL